MLNALCVVNRIAETVDFGAVRIGCCIVLHRGADICSDLQGRRVQVQLMRQIRIAKLCTLRRLAEQRHRSAKRRPYQMILMCHPSSLPRRKLIMAEHGGTPHRAIKGGPKGGLENRQSRKLNEIKYLMEEVVPLA